MSDCQRDHIIFLQVTNELLSRENSYLQEELIAARQRLAAAPAPEPKEKLAAPVTERPLGGMDRIILKAVSKAFDVSEIRANAFTHGVVISPEALRERLEWLRDKGLVKHVEATDSWWIVQHA